MPDLGLTFSKHMSYFLAGGFPCHKTMNFKYNIGVSVAILGCLGLQDLMLLGFCWPSGLGPRA